jgi:hypothetical protein
MEIMLFQPRFLSWRTGPIDHAKYISEEAISIQNARAACAYIQAM